VTNPTQYKVWNGFYDDIFAPVNKANQAKISRRSTVPIGQS